MTNGHTHPLADLTPITNPNITLLAHSTLASIDKGKGRQPAFPLLPVGGSGVASKGRLPMGPGAVIDLAAENLKDVSKLVDMSVACRHLAAQCQMRQGKWADATEMLGEANPFRGSGK